ncbi:MAG: radical SAM protein [Lachnospiraceae bacterium]|nr:radical SAM protein [Lachnospiraceae bacterium]
MYIDTEVMIAENMLPYINSEGLHIYDRNHGFSQFVFTGVEEDIIKAVNSYHDLHEVWSQVSTKYGVGDSKKAKISFFKYVEKLYDNHIIDYGGIDRVIMGKPDRIYPLFCSIELTNVCNFTCSHCYKEAGPSCEEYISLESIRKIADNLKNHLYSIDLTGGEATIHPEFTEIVKMLDGPKLHLLTNGSRLADLDNEILKRFEIIQVSLYGKSVEEYLKFAQNIGFKKVCDGIKRVTDMKIPLVIAINLREDIIDDIESYIEICRSLGVKSVRFGIPLKSGRNDGVITDWDISPDKMKEFVDKNRILREKYNDIDIQEFNKADIRRKKRITKNRATIVCGAGKTDICVSEKGLVRPCVMLPENYFGGITIEEYISKVEMNTGIDYTDVICETISKLRDRGKTIDSFCESAFA